MFTSCLKKPRVYTISVISLAGFLLSSYVYSATPSAEEMWQIIQQQQQTIETLQARLDSTQQQREDVNVSELEKRISENEAKLDATATMIDQQATGTAAGWWNQQMSPKPS